MSRKIALIYNPRSGFFVGWKSAEIKDYLRSLLNRQTEPDLKLVPFHGRKRKTILPQIKKDAINEIWIAGGDGTINSIVQILSGSGIPIGILPCGTMNLLARDLGMSLDIKTAVKQLKSSHPVKIDKVTLNGKLILNICNIGISTNFTEMREKFRHDPGWIRWPLLAWYMLKSVFVYPVMTIELNTGRHYYKFKTRSVSISNNPLDRDSILLPGRQRIDTGRLGIYVAKHRSIWSLPILMCKLVVGNWLYDEHLSVFSTKKATISPVHRRKLKVMIDGELFKIKRPLNFKVHPKSLTLLYPKEGA